MENLYTSLLTVPELIVTAERILKALEPVKNEQYVIDFSELVKRDLEKYNKAGKNESSGKASAELKKLDLSRDRSFIALRDFIKANSNRGDKDIARAAGFLYAIIRKHGSGLWNLGYTGESARLGDLFIDLAKPEAEEHLKKTGADIWLEELKAAQDSFESFYQKKIAEESAGKEPVSLKETVTLLRQDLRLLLNSIEAIARLRPAGITEIIARLDEIIIDIMTVVKARKTRAENEAFDLEKGL